jgi:hypothetical protein
MSMQGIPTWFGALVIVTISASFVHAQSFYYKEILKDGRIYVFNIPEEADRFEKSGEMGRAITRPGAGPNGETVVADSERALELFFFKHGISEPVQLPPPPPPPPPPWRISGLVFGDYYWFSSNHLSTWEDQHGFWIRRAYFTYDHRFTPNITTRLRLEVNSNGQLEGGNLEPYVKDVYVQWTYFRQHGVTLGIQPSATFNWLEGFWGLRHIEKTPADLYRIDSSRDFGLSVEGPFLVPAARYVAQFGNEAGTGSEADKYKAVRFEGRFDTNPGFALEGFYGNFQRANNQDRHTAQVFAGFRTPIGRAGLQYLYQQRQSGTASPDTEINIVSAFGVFDPIRQKLSLFARVDWVNDRLPGADGIDYLPIDPGSKFTYFLGGFEWYLHPSLRFSPNVEVVRYRDIPVGRDIDTDVVPRMTFYWTW